MPPSNAHPPILRRDGDLKGWAAESPYLFTPPSLALDRCAFAHKSLARLNSAYAGAYKHKTRGP